MIAPPMVRLTRSAVFDALGSIPDPEIPAVSIVELGMVGDLAVEPSRIRVELLPTFVGCPAIEVIRESIVERLAGFGVAVDVVVSFSTPWSSDRISPEGREKLRRSGFAPPPGVPAGRALPMLDWASAPGVAASDTDAVACPYCGSLRTTLENIFGPTLCRSIRHCHDCRQPFESFKPI